MGRILLDDHQGLVELDRLGVGDQELSDLAGARARIGFITFIASTISRVSPCFTVSPTPTKAGAPGSAER